MNYIYKKVEKTEILFYVSFKSFLFECLETRKTSSLCYETSFQNKIILISKRESYTSDGFIELKFSFPEYRFHLWLIISFDLKKAFKVAHQQILTIQRKLFIE
jgi:hypothetical protein